MHVAIASFKGGVGKTTTAIHIAAYLQTLAPTLLLDGDATRNATEWSERGPGLPYRVADVRSAMKLAKQFEHSVIDTGQRPSDADLKALAEGCDLLIIPAVPATMDSDGLRLTISALQTLGAENYRVLITKMPPPPEPEGNNLRAALERANVPVFSVGIPRLKAFERAAAGGLLVSQVDDPRAKRAWEAYLTTGKEALKYANRH
ncbi:ParA family protein [Terriglobus aquaticus]|jgi:chromosome partitioning protein|uniref:Plasmid segregation oscillating ATPase ParF n=3 Tax=Terriglobus TaxID=392733 RepID=A0A1H4W2I2_9BACT|nr:plasmid segregation oscillating ATPase ParF [Terriglobus roseus]